MGQFAYRAPFCQTHVAWGMMLLFSESQTAAVLRGLQTSAVVLADESSTNVRVNVPSSVPIRKRFAYSLRFLERGTDLVLFAGSCARNHDGADNLEWGSLC